MPERRAGRALLLWGGALLTLVVLPVLAAPWLAPYQPRDQLDPAASRLRPPGTALWEVRLQDGRRWAADRVERVPGGLRLERRGRSILLPAAEVANLTPEGVEHRRLHLLGTDRFGRDLLSRLLWGGRTSLRVGVAAALVALLAGTLVGGVAGYAGGWTEAVLLRIVDGFLAFPRLFLVLAVAALWAGELALVLVLGATGWMESARITRGEVRRLRGSDLALAARATGASPARVLVRHLLPAVVPTLLVLSSLQVGDLILTEAALSFLGLGVPPPLPSWGNLIAEARDVLLTAWWLTLPPGVALTLTVLGCNLLAEGLRERWNPEG